jgi:short-subunit dehydrogenase
MKTQKSGQILAISSIIAKFGAPFLSTYSASKHALEGYLESLRYEVEADNIHISLVCPGFVATNIDVKALTKDGSTFNIKSEAQSKGIAPSRVGKAVISSIKSKKRYKYVGKFEILMPYLNFMLPKTFYFILKKLHKL